MVALGDTEHPKCILPAQLNKCLPGRKVEWQWMYGILMYGSGKGEAF